MAAKIGGWLLYLAVVGGLIFVGWNEPLRYRFLSRAAIDAIENPPPPPTPPPDPTKATPPPGAWMKDPTRTNPLETRSGGSGPGPVRGPR